MPLFRHPCLVRGVVYTDSGAFVISRGIVDVPEEVGQAFAWIPVAPHPEPPASARLTADFGARSNDELVADSRIRRSNGN
jgi:hypothetical protein